jgi:hypothetical protein
MSGFPNSIEIILTMLIQFAFDIAEFFRTFASKVSRWKPK